ncbi:BNR-4 repeat-containing protein [Brachybacterium sp. DNPG3]
MAVQRDDARSLSDDARSDARSDVRTAVVDANGGWCWFQDERALVDPVGGRLLIGAVASSAGHEGESRGGDIDLHVVDLAAFGAADAAADAGADAVRTVVLHAGLESDDHDDPALWRRDDGRWLAVYSRHKSDDLTRWRISETDDPAGAWGPERAVDWRTLFTGADAEEVAALGGHRGVTYQNLHRIDGVLHCFVRAINDDPCYLVSHDDGESWEFGGRLLTREKVGYVNGYARYASPNRFAAGDGPTGADASPARADDGAGRADGRLDLIITEHHPRDMATSIWHGYLAGGALHRADGTVVGPLGRGLREATPRAEDLTCVFANGTVWGGSPMTHAWTTDLRSFADGTVVALFTARADDTLGTSFARDERAAREGHEGPRRPPEGPVDHRFFRAVLRPGSAAWEVRELAVAGPHLMPHEEDYTGLGTIDPDDPEQLWISTPVDPRDSTALARHEIFRGRLVAGADGVTGTDDERWEWTPITPGTARSAFRPIAVPGDPTLQVLTWYQGTMDASQRYDAEIVARVEPR